MAQPPRTCLTCGVSTQGTRCPTCTTRHNTARTARRVRPHYTGDYQRKAKQVRDNATVCWLCGLGAKPNDPWTADHVQPANPDSLLLAAHRSCNSSRGNKQKQ